MIKNAEFSGYYFYMNKNKYLTGFKSALVHLQVIQSDSSNCNFREAFMAPEIWLL